ncbi:MAG: PEGA domain-containing protein [Fibrobacteria bacterium]|nr:PEGA domain-containing protein [Fibrobacteria bacterium]
MKSPCSFFLPLLTIIIPLYFSGCSTLVKGLKQPIYVDSKPSGAKIIVDNKEAGKTPANIYLKKKGYHNIDLELNGYPRYSMDMKKRIDPWFWGNVACFGGWPICFAGDYFLGPMYRFSQDSILVDFTALHNKTEDNKTTSSPDSPVKTINIAVMDLKSMGVKEHVSLLLAEKLRSELFATGQFSVMNREDMTKVLEEQSFQQSDHCETMECMAEMGKMLGVSNIISGSIGQLGKTYSLTLKMVNIESAKNEKIINLNKKCEEDELIKLIEEATSQFVPNRF